MEMVKDGRCGELVGADELNDVAAEAFLKIVDAVVWTGGIGKTVDAIEIIMLKAVLGGIFYHVPLNEVLCIIFAHVAFVAARK